jgi:colanic acid/amylovoran biosynthesis protein
MIDMTSQEQSRAYIPFMVSCAKYLLEKKSNPFILIHEGHKDMHLAQKIAKGAGGEIPIIKEDHPLNIKGILGSCQGSIGSRFHGLVSALSQGVPSLATGWSHKYKMLFKDYDFEDGLLDVTIDEKDIRKKIELIIDPDNRQKVQSVIIAKSNELKQQSENMWSKVFEILGVPIQSDQPG